MLMDPLHPLAIRWRQLPAALPWFARFAMNSRRRRVEEIALALKVIYSHVLDAYDTLLEDADARDLIVRRGRLTIYESEKALHRDAYAMELRRRHGMDVKILSGDEAREMEPALAPLVKRAAFVPQYAHTVNPLRLTQVLAENFVRNGGTLLRQTVKGFERSDRGPPRVLTDAGGHDADWVVIAAGAYSRRMAAELGSRVLLESERGYHLSMADPGVTFTRTVMSSERFITITQMEPGLRVSGISEFSGLEAPPRYRFADVVLKHARELIPELNPARCQPLDGKPAFDTRFITHHQPLAPPPERSVRLRPFRPYPGGNQRQANRGNGCRPAHHHRYHAIQGGPLLEHIRFRRNILH